MKKLAAILAVALLGLTGRVHAQPAEFVQGEVLVQFTPDAADGQIQQAFANAGLELREVVGKGRAANRGLIRAATKMPVDEAVKALNRQPGVAFAEPNWIYQHHATANDPYFTSTKLWGMYGDTSNPANPYGSQAAEAWAQGHTGSASVYIGVIDEGYEISHPDLAPNIGTNPGEIAGNGVDDDGNGYIDDVYGWDFDGNDASVYDGTGDDHGTHVAGTIGASGGNQQGVVGVSWNVKMLNAKFLGSRGGTTANAIKAVDYFTDLKQRHGINLVALNNSWGGGGYSQGLHDAIIRAADAGILFVAAAGNGDRFGRGIDNDVSPQYPASYDTMIGTSTKAAASYDSVIAVTAIDSSGNKAAWANYGKNSVDIGAPGVSIWSTVPGHGYNAYSGTSMATPHVAGAAALFASTHPAESAAQIKAALLGSAQATASLVGITATEARLDLSEIIAPPVPQPTVVITAPADGTGFELSADESSATVNFSGTALDADGLTSLDASIEWSSAEIIFGTGSTAAAAFTQGTHTITATVVNAAGQTAVSSITIHVGVQPPPPAEPEPAQLVVDIGFDRNPPDYFNRDNVQIAILATDGISPVAGASVNVTIATPKGAQLAGSGTTDSNGLAVFNYKVNSKAHGTGSYDVSSTASKAGYVSGSSTSSFTVIK